MKAYFYKTRNGTADTEGNHWVFGRFQNKEALVAENRESRPFEIIAASQLLDKMAPADVREIAKSVLDFQPHVYGDFPREIQALL